MGLKVAAILFLSMLVFSCEASGIIASHGETWINWEWNESAPVTAYVDGTMELENSSLQFYYLTDIEPNEEHRLDLFIYTGDVLEPAGSSTVKTTPQTWLAILVLVVSVGLALLLLALQNPIEVILTGSICMVFSIFLATNTWAQLGALSGIGYAIIIFAAIWVTKALWDLTSKKAAWW